MITGVKKKTAITITFDEKEKDVLTEIYHTLDIIDDLIQSNSAGNITDFIFAYYDTILDFFYALRNDIQMIEKDISEYINSKQKVIQTGNI